MPDLIKTGRYQQDEEEKKRKASSQPVQTIQKPSGQTIRIQEPSRQASTQQTVQMPTATQQIMAQPVQQKWYRGDQPTGSEMAARIMTIGQQNKQAGEQLWNAFQGFQNDPANPLYNPYKKSSSKALQELGKIFNVDLSNGVGEDFIKENAWLMKYYRTGTGGTPLAPSKKSSPLENAAYWYYKVVNDEAGTQQAENEWNALREEISYWTRRADRNYTDDEILNKIDWKKYPTLASLDASKTDGVPMSLNRGIGYSQDNLRGVIWAARNGSTGDAFLDAVQYARGVGNMYEENELRAMGRASSDEYAPYMLASTMDDLAKKYNTYGFDRNWLEQNKSVLDSGDEEAINEYQKIARAEETTRKAEDEWYNLRNDILYWANSNRNYSDDQILQMIDWSKYRTLQKMDEDAEIGSPTELTRGIGYSQSALQNFLKNARGESVGQTWHENQETRARLDPTSDSYLPYILGATGDQMDEAALYFSRADENGNLTMLYGFDKNWVTENAWMKASMDQTQREMYYRVASAEEFTSSCEQQRGKLEEKLSKYMLNQTDPDKIIKRLNNWIEDDDDFSDLKKLQGSLKPSKKLLNTTRAIDFDLKDWEQQIREYCAKNKSAQDDNTKVDQTISTLGAAPGGGFSESDNARIQGENKTLSDASDTIDAKGTEAEKERFKMAGNAATDEITEKVLLGIKTGDMDPKVGYDTVLQDAEQYTADNYWGAAQIISDYENVQQLITETQKQIDDLQNSPINDQVDEAKIQELEQQMAELNQRLQQDEELGKYLNEGVNATLNINGKDYNISAELNDEGKWDVSAPASQSAENITNEISNAIINVRLNADPESSHAVWGNEFLTNTIDPLIQQYAAIYDVPEEDVSRISADFHKQWFANYYSGNDVLRGMVDDLAANLREAGTDDADMVNAVVSSWASELPQFESSERLTPEELDAINTQQNEITGQIEGIRNAPDAAREERQAKLDQLNGQLSSLQDELNWQQENFNSAQGTIKDIEKRYQDAFDIADINNIDVGVSLDQMMMAAMWRSYQENSHDTLKGAQKWYDTATGAEKEQARRNLWFLENKEKYDEILNSEEFKTYKENMKSVPGQSEVRFVPKNMGMGWAGQREAQFTSEMYNHMTDDEWAMYKFLGENQGAQAADEYFQYLEYELGKRTRTAITDAYQNKASDWLSAVDSSISSVLDNFLSGRGSASVVSQNINNWMADMGLSNKEWKPVNYDTVGNMFGLSSRAAREHVSSLVDWQVKVLGQDKDLFDFLYGTAMSGVDSAAAGLTGAWGGALLLGAGAAEGTMQDMRERNASDSQILLGGLLAGAAETIFEHVSLSALYDEEKVLAAGGMKNIVKNIFAQMGINASEEFNTEVANILSEILVMGENNKYNQQYQEYVKKYGEKEAKKRLAQDIALQTFEAALGGGLMGGFFGVTRGASAYKQAESLKNEQAAETTKRVYTLKGALSEEDVAKKIASISAAMTFGDNAADADMAKAASLKLADEFGADNIASVMSDMLLYAQKNGMDPSMVNQVAVLGGLGNSLTTSALNTAIDRGINAETMQMLQAAVVTDEASQDVRKAVQKATRDDRIARYTLYKKVASGALESVKTAEADVQKSQENLESARQDLEDQRSLLEAKGNQVSQSFDELQADPGNENTARAAEAAVGEFESQGVAVKQREAALAKAEQEYEAAQKRLDDARSVYDQTRNEAAAEVDAEDQQRAEEARLAEEQAQAQAEQEAAEQAATEENNNIATMNADDFIENMLHGDVTEEERQKVYEMFRQKQMQTNATETASENALPTNATTQRRNTFTQQIGQKFGINIAFEDTTRGGKVSRQNGYYDRRNNRIVLDENATIDDAIYFVAGHELTHVAERSETYDDLASSLLRLKYGKDMDYRRLIDDINRRNDRSRAAQDIMGKMYLYNNRLAQMHEQDASIDATPLTVEEAAQEVVADIMGEILHDNQDMVDRLVAEEPSTARRILDSIKSFLRKLTGMDGQWKNDIQGVVDKLETALKDAQGTQEQNDQIKYHIGQTTDGRQYVDVDTDQNIFDGLTPRQILSKAKSIIKERFKGQEFQFEDGNATVTKRTAEEYSYPVTRRMPDDIREAKGRASTELDNLLKVSEQILPGDPDYPQTQYSEGHNKDVQKWSYYRTLFRIGNQQFKGIVNIARMQDFSRVYDITRISQDTSWTALHEDNLSGASADVSDNMITQAQPIVKPIAENNSGDPLAEELRGGTVTKDYSFSSWTPEEQTKVRQALIKNGFAEADVDKWISDTNSIASMIAADRTRLDFEADPEKTMLKPNDEYVKTLDASTLCAKRLLYQGTFDAIQHLLPNTALLPEDLIDLSNMMREMGYEVPCGICYVESRRRQLGKFTEQWLESYEGEYKPTISDVTTSDGLEKLRQEHPQAYQDFISAMNKKGVVNPKVVQLQTDYRGEIRKLRPSQIQKVKNIGGLRVQSFSDFEVPHLLDMVQAVMDMASKHLTAQAYTKVPNFAWAFGDTGIKINLSLIGAGTGLDANGNLVFDDVEGMPFEEAMKLRERYSQNVGTILVGINDAHILAAMADDRIDFIIPFHKSGWSAEELNRMPVLNSYTDYTSSQNEKKIIGKDKNGYKTESLDESKRVNFQPVGENGYWDFNKTGKENAETYLKMCAEDGRIPKFSQFLVDNGDGSFSLQPDGSTDGYWKTLIDFKMYDNNGVGSAQQEVTPNVNMEEAQRILNEYTLDRNGIHRESNNDLPVAEPVVERYVEEYKAKHPRTQYSLPELDQEYSKAVANNDMETAQKMVDEAAEAAGYNTGYVMWRGDSAPYNVLKTGAELDEENDAEYTDDHGNLGNGLYFTPDRAYAEQFARRGGVLRKFYLKSNMANLDDADTRALRAAIKESIEDEIGDFSRDELYERLMDETGTDGIMARGVGGFSAGAREAIVRESWQAKLADPVTYDDNGKMINLSERFNQETSDIRYSLPSDDILDQMISSYLASGGMLSTNVKASVPGQVRTNPNQKQRQFGSQTAQRNDALHEQVKQHLRENSGYDPDTNQAQVDRAISWVQRHASEGDENGYQGALDEILSPDFNFASADGQARMLTVMSMAALQNRASDEMKIAVAFNEQGTTLGQALQARQLFQMMTPVGRERSIRMLEERLNRQYREQGKYDVTVHLSDETIQMARDAKSDQEFKQVQQRAYKELAEQMPSNWKDKLRAIRYFSMLFNPVTHIRNMIGNAGFMPAVGLKNAIGAGIERAKGLQERTKTIQRASKEARDFARKDAVTMKDTLTGESKYFESNPVERERKTFKGWFQKAIDFNSNLLETEDWIFLRRHYANALSGWMTANNMTPAQLQNDSAALGKARAYAIEEAQKATYRDASRFASTLSRISKEGGVAGFIVDAALPFKKTPTNILKRGIEYSPLGLLKTIVLDSHKLHTYNEWVKKGQEWRMPAKALTPNQYFDRIASGLSGTAISAVGALMAAMGWLKVDLGDDDEIAKQNGEQEYALHVSLFGQDVSYTIDWLAPSSMPLFVGASIYNEAMADHNNEDALDVAADLTDSFLKITEPVFNLSMLDGVNSLLQTSSWGDDAGNNITDIGATLASNYVTSFVPTVLGKVAKTTDTTRRETFIESGTSKTKGMLQRTWQKTLAKIPGATNLLKPYVSPLGEEEQSSTVAAIVQNFLSPGYFKTVEISDMEQEMQRLYEATGDKTAIPKQPTKFFTAGGEKINLNAEQYTQLQKTRGSIAKDVLNQVVESPEYQIYGDDAKIKMVKDAWEYATQLAKIEIDPRVTVDSWIVKGQDDPLQALITRRENAARDEYIADHKSELLKALDEEDYASASANIEGLYKADKDDSYIRGEITRKYKPIYLDAYEKDDYDTMDDIEMKLDMLDIGYKSKTFSDWIKEYEKKKEAE